MGRWATPRHIAGAAIVVVYAAASHSTAAKAVDLTAAELQFKTSCGVCHTAVEGGPPRQGPNLNSVYGRSAGTLADFKYSDALKNGGWRWDEATLDPWIEDPQTAHPGTFMNYRQSNPEKRKLVIEYLRSLAKPN
jgi:cytochrome c